MGTNISTLNSLPSLPMRSSKRNNWQRATVCETIGEKSKETPSKHRTTVGDTIHRNTVGVTIARKSKETLSMHRNTVGVTIKGNKSEETPLMESTEETFFQKEESKLQSWLNETTGMKTKAEYEAFIKMKDEELPKILSAEDFLDKETGNPCSKTIVPEVEHGMMEFVMKVKTGTSFDEHVPTIVFAPSAFGKTTWMNSPENAKYNCILGDYALDRCKIARSGYAVNDLKTMQWYRDYVSKENGWEEWQMFCLREEIRMLQTQRCVTTLFTGTMVSNKPDKYDEFLKSLIAAPGEDIKQVPMKEHWEDKDETPIWQMRPQDWIFIIPTWTTYESRVIQRNKEDKSRYCNLDHARDYLDSYKHIAEGLFNNQMRIFRDFPALESVLVRKQLNFHHLEATNVSPSSWWRQLNSKSCLLYTSDAADE